MIGFTWPYQQSADPILPVPLFDSWGQPLSEPVRTKPFILAAVVALSLAYVGEPITAPEDIFLDKWHKPLSEPLHSPERLHAALNPFEVNDTEGLTLPEDVKLSSWYAEFARPGPPIPPTPQQYFAYVRDVEAQPLNWYRELAVPTLPKPSVAYQQAFADEPDALTRPEEVKASSWYRDLDVPVIAKFVQQITEFKFVKEFLEFPDFDGWYRQFSQPVLVADNFSYTYESFVTDYSLLPLSNWYRQFEPPTLSAPRQVEYPSAFVEDFEAAAPAPSMDWLRQLEVPLFEAAPVIWVRGTSIEFETPLFDTDWLRQLETPPNAARAVAYQQPVGYVDDFVVPPAPSMDSWYRRLELPTLPARRVASFFHGPLGAVPIAPPPPPAAPDTKNWAEEAATTGVWAGEVAVADAWAEETALASSWTEEDPNC